MLVEHKRIKLREPFDLWMAALTSRRGVDLKALDIDVIAAAHALSFNGDPFDRAIVATAIVMDLPLITKDEAIVTSRLINIVW